MRLALPRLPAHLPRLYDAFPEGVALLDCELRIVLLNAAFRAMTGATGVRRGQGFETIPTLRPAIRHADRMPWRQVIAGEERPAALRLSVRHASGVVRDLLLTASAMRGGDGCVQGALVLLADRSSLEAARLRAESANAAALSEHAAGSGLETDDLRRLAMTDPLSGAMNRRAFYTHAQQRFAHAVDHGGAIAAILADLDYFKSINDNHGHHVGDRAIQAFARILLASVRSEEDLVCRYGGEEFAVLLPGMTGAEAAEVAERIRVRLEQEAGLALTSDAPLRVTASFGVAGLTRDHACLEHLLADADRLLYRAKRRGRNQVCLLDRDADSTGSQRELELAADDLDDQAAAELDRD